MKDIKSPFSNSTLKSFLKCKDYTVSNETFSLLRDRNLDILITYPKPKIIDLAKYYESKDYISHTDAKESLVDKLYQYVKNHTIKKKVLLIDQLIKTTASKNILDIGCGTGDFLVACKNSNWNVIGVEPNKNARVITKSKLGILKSKIENYSTQPEVFETIDKLENNKFDIITMWHVLEHVPNLEEYIIQLKQLLKEKGTLIIAVPNYKSYDAMYYKKFWAAYDVPRHLWHFSRKAIKLLFKKENLKVVKVLPMKFDSFYVSLLSEKYKTGKTNFIKAFFIGLKSNFKAMRTKEYSSLIYIIKNS